MLTAPLVTSSLTAVEVAAVRVLAAAAETADGHPPLSDQVLLHLADPGTHLLLRGEAGLVGYAGLTGGAAELVVAPTARRRGAGRALLTALLPLAPRRLEVWAHGEHPGATRLAQEVGATRARVLLRMQRALGPDLPPVDLPAGVSLRTFVPGRDEAAWTDLNARSFAAHPEQGSWEREEVVLREQEPWFDAAGFLLAERADRLVGFHWTKVHEQPVRTGEVYVLGVDPQAQGGGLGRALTLAGLHHLRERGLPAVLLYVDEDNAAAVRVYERLGFRTASADVQWALAPHLGQQPADRI